MKTVCCFCDNPHQDVICDNCVLRIVSQTDDFKDLLFLVTQIATAQNMSETMEAIMLITEVYNRLRGKSVASPPLDMATAVNNFKREHLQKVAQLCGGKRVQMAEILDMQRTYVSTLIRELGLSDKI